MGRGKGRGRLSDFEKDGKKNYRLHWTDAQGYRKQKDAGTNKAHAERLLNQIIADRDKQEAGLGLEVGLERKLADHLEGYEAWQKERNTESHARRTTRAVARVLEHIPATRVRELDVAQLTRYQALRAKEGVANRTVNLETDALKTFINWLVRQGQISSSPIAALKSLPTDSRHRKRERRALSEEEARGLLEASRRRDIEWERPIGYAMVWELLLNCGARFRELNDCTWGDVDMQAETITIRVAKIRRPRIIPWLDPGLGTKLTQYREKQEEILGREVGSTDPILRSPEGEPVTYRNAYRDFRGCLTEAQIDTPNEAGITVDIYSLRKTFGTWLAAMGLPVATLAQLMGHKDPKTTLAYYVEPQADAHKQQLEGLGIRNTVSNRLAASPADKQRIASGAAVFGGPGSP